MNHALQRIAKFCKGAVVPILIVGSLVAVVILAGPPHVAEQAADEIWTCSMHPHLRLPKAGQCPICGMNLIPLSQLESEQARVEERAGLETERLVHRELFRDIRTVGKLDYNERRLAYLTARIAGRVDRVYADFTGIQVKKGDHLVAIYSPDLYTAQAELLLALQASEQAKGDRRFVDANLEATRTKLLLLGILPAQIDEIEKSRQVTPHLTIYAPIGGVVIEKGIREQQYVKEGDMLYRIA
jgi:Cu(I)/Ag(I) efflux system membrane fusion protein